MLQRLDRVAFAQLGEHPVFLQPALQQPRRRLHIPALPLGVRDFVVQIPQILSGQHHRVLEPVQSFM
ncbi:hypothetical protein D3C73_1489040 [compost metagenome]